MAKKQQTTGDKPSGFSQLKLALKDVGNALIPNHETGEDYFSVFHLPGLLPKLIRSLVIVAPLMLLELWSNTGTYLDPFVLSIIAVSLPIMVLIPFRSRVHVTLRDGTLQFKRWNIIRNPTEKTYDLHNLADVVHKKSFWWGSRTILKFTDRDDVILNPDISAFLYFRVDANEPFVKFLKSRLLSDSRT